MSGPERWQHDDASPPEVRELLKRARGAGRSRPLPPESKARSAARLDRMLALPAAAGILLWLKGVAIAAGVAVVGVVAARQVMSPPEAPAASASAAIAPVAPAPRRAMPVAPVASTTPSAAPEPVPEVTGTPTPPAPSAATRASVQSPRAEPKPSAEADSLEQEAAMLDRARAQLASDPASALATVDAQAAAFPAGHMGLERELIAIEALRRLHRVTEARARGEALLRRAPGSLYEGRVRAILGSLPPP